VDALISKLRIHVEPAPKLVSWLMLRHEQLYFTQFDQAGCLIHGVLKPPLAQLTPQEPTQCLC